MYTKKQCREFIRHYLVAALWSSHDYRSEVDSSDYDPSAGECMDDSFEPDQLHPGCRADVRNECMDFIRRTHDAGIDLMLVGGNVEWGAMAQHGHDFWLTRCGHGAGFWDRGYGAIGETLSTIAREAGNRDCVPCDSDTFTIE